MLWIEDTIESEQSVPRPTLLDQLRTDSEWSRPSWILGFATVHPALFNESADRINITLPRRILVRLDRRAKEANETRSGTIAQHTLAV